ncbi:hypothetical protein ACFXPS_24995 [Nocardia sp. NPDC059091]|uniref:hypothetical protein n=1 Tax=Nocardia sp. NPDC059091 TaxID=3346724 RepID=UPI0036B7D605
MSVVLGRPGSWTPQGHCASALPPGWVVERFTVQLPVVGRTWHRHERVRLTATGEWG